MTRKNVWLGVALSLAVPVVVLASNLLVPNAFAPGTTISSAQVNANFQAVQTAVNNRADVYGDGSAGAMTVSANANWGLAPPPQQNFQFTSLTVASGVTLRVPSGLFIQVTGNVNILGTIVVETFTVGGVAFVGPAGDAWVRSPEAGIARSAAMAGQHGSNNQQVNGGAGGTGLTAVIAGSILRPGPRGGGGGAGSTGNYAGQGGGTLVIVAGGALSNGGVIRANGETSTYEGGGGGGGGIVVLASKVNVVNSGRVEAFGGAGGPSGPTGAAGGGGGGGIIQLLGTVVTNTGMTDVSSGVVGAIVPPFSGTGTRYGGGGGGASGGEGGNGGFVTAANVVMQSGAVSTAGYAIVRTVDPTSLL